MKLSIEKENLSLIRESWAWPLPPRLREELKQAQDYLLERERKAVAISHQAWGRWFESYSRNHHRN